MVISLCVKCKHLGYDLYNIMITTHTVTT